MPAYPMPLSRLLGFLSLIFGLVGGAFCWWTPFGMILSFGGVVIGIVAWMYAGRESRPRGLIVGATALCVATFILNLVIAQMGIEVIQIHALR